MQRGRFSASRSRWALGAAAVAAVTLAVAGCSSGSSSSTAAAGSTPSAAGSAASAPPSSVPSSASASPDTSFYNGKTITMIIPTRAGGGYDPWGRLLADYMGRYLHATIKVSNVPAGNTIVGQNQLASSPPNGLVIGWLNILTDVQLKASNTKGLNFDPTSDVEIIGGTPAGASGIFVQASSPYKTVADLTHASSELKAITVTTGANALILRTILGAYGVKVHYITGYDNTADLATGFLRGDGVITSMPAVSGVDAIKDGKIRGIVTAASPASGSSVYDQLKDEPTISDLLTQSPPPTADGKEAVSTLVDVTSIGQVLAVPKGVPESEVAALTAAMQWSMSQPSAIASALKSGNNPGPTIPPSTVKADISSAYADAGTLAPYAGTGA